MSIDGTLELITKSTTLISTGDIIAIIVASISLAGVIFTTILTNRTTKKINTSNSKLQEKWNQKNIDASLVASARIEWIQNVRKTTSELIQCYYNILNTSEHSKIDEALINSQEKTELLILYFGPENNARKETSNYKHILSNTEKNEGKNDILVSFLINLAENFNAYSQDAKKDKYNHLKTAVENARNEAYQNATETFVGFTYTDDGDTLPEYDYEFQDEDAASLEHVEKALKKEIDRIKNLRNDLVFLRNVMRIYLKLEWNEAKKGQ